MDRETLDDNGTYDAGTASLLNVTVQIESHNWVSLDLFKVMEYFQCTFTDTYKASKIVFKVRLLKLRIKTHSFLKDIKTSSNKI